jgi:hypothetical protein
MNAISAMPPPKDVLVLLRLSNGMEMPGMRTGDAGRMAYEYPHPPGGITDFRPTHWKKLAKEAKP